MYAVILAGGSGTRFWPKSREQLPKQLLNINGERTMIQDTLNRISPIVGAENIWVITNEKHALETCRQLKATNFNLSQLLTEPIARNTAAAIAYSASILSQKNPDAIMAVFPADHAITTHKQFLELIEKAKIVAENNHLVTLGIKPTSPETGYGYIKQGKLLEGNAYKVDQFIEKPDKATAEKYLTEGGYYWNSGMFIWKVSVLLNEIKRYLPNLYTQLDKLSKNTTEAKGPYPFKELNNSGKKIFQSLQPVSIDHGIMESSSNSVVFPANIGWNDVGSWTALADISQKDFKGNVIKGNVFSIENNNSIFYAEERLVAAMGLKNMIVVDTSDAILICHKDYAQDVKKVVEKIKLEKRPEVSTAPNSEIRPWGNYVILQKEANYLVKRIEVLPGESLSLQSHKHRSEHWTIVAGTAQVQINELSKTLQANQFIEIPKGAKHRLANHSQSPLIIIEVQLGENLDESDIIRYEDKYGRTPKGKDN
jgi:mannose-1-phosphate guanylyltransferase / mannose-6-phosphate isomerase